VEFQQSLPVLSCHHGDQPQTNNISLLGENLYFGKEIKFELRSENQFWAGQNGTIKIAFPTLSLMIFSVSANVILSSWRPATNKQYQFAWRKFVFWCRQPSEKDVIEYINVLKNQNLSYKS
jgi:hypothetical protein